MQHTMHRWTSVLVLSLGLIAAPLAHAAKPPLTVVKDYMAGWNAHDPNQAAMNMDVNVEYYDVTVGEAQQGVVVARDNVIKFFIASFPDLKWSMVGDPIVTRDAVVFRWQFTGTNTGPNIDATVNEGKPTGKPIALSGLSMIKVRDGKIVYQGDYYDALSLNKQLGNIK
ncbi:ester cyclase [Crenobacter sp. SG2303]|uniref:Ester cyclase n=1 Tax=Crenobacter oryzisoli TaxID=3056844 RepID=A0ABT7XSK6_9NEIS|nr:ester cyclase [Crenobacter sp. SG2303]MDN0076776.1 ester cyclase [Crenobacter sp. SG2303]